MDPSAGKPSTGDAIIKWVTFSIAILGVLQPYLIAAWRRYFRPRKITAHVSWPPDFAFSGLGPTLGIGGTLYCQNASSFIEDITLVVTRLSDGTQRRLRPMLARKRTVTNDGRDLVEGRVWSPFQGVTDTAYEIDILFADPASRTRAEQITKEFTNAWAFRILSSIPAGTDLTDSEQVAALAAQTVTLYQQTSGEPFQMTAWQKYRELLFWQAGDFRIDMLIRTVEGGELPAQRWKVTFSPQDEATFEANINVVRALAANIPAQMAGTVVYVFRDLTPIID